MARAAPLRYVILDIDGTLVDGDRPENIVERPGLAMFLSTLFVLFEGRVGIWTAANKEWLQLVVHRHLRPKIPAPYHDFLFMLSAEHCMQIMITRPLIGTVRAVLKPLRMLPVHLRAQPGMAEVPNADNSIIIDDTPDTFMDNPGSAILIKRFLSFDLLSEYQQRVFDQVIAVLRQLQLLPVAVAAPPPLQSPVTSSSLQPGSSHPNPLVPPPPSPLTTKKRTSSEEHRSRSDEPKKTPTPKKKKSTMSFFSIPFRSSKKEK